jgi:hypothetical protein
LGHLLSFDHSLVPVPSYFDDRTDSGYASQTRASGLVSTGQGTLARIMSDHDDQTTYLDLSSLSNGRLGNFISEFSEELAAGLPQSIPLSQLSILSTALPSLLEAFAGRFGYEESSTRLTRLYLMRLVCRYRL